jgi:tRNA U34 5-methylaminomethyl-2-thiouridine-forming methyltransferase MnmC
MTHEVLKTDDGSHTLKNKLINETYHSVHGAIQESLHVFIEPGLKKCAKQQISILEIGFGTGLNAFLALLEAERSDLKIEYTTLELYPLPPEAWAQLNYPEILAKDKKSLFYDLHSCPWNEKSQITLNFSIQKIKADFSYSELTGQYDIIFFDAFSPEKQPELWTANRFKEIAKHCNPAAILTTYCAKGIVKRALKEAGFCVERLEGPPGKRHMLRAGMIQA